MIMVFEIVALQVFVLAVFAREEFLSDLLEKLIEERLVNSFFASKSHRKREFLRFAPAL